MDIEFKVNKQIIKSYKSRDAHFFKGSKGGAIRYHFLFDSTWDQYTKKAIVFNQDEDKAAAIDKNGIVTVPDEFLSTSHLITVYGQNDDSILSSQPFRVIVG